MCGVANVVCDTKMSHETSWLTDACIFRYFLGWCIVFLDVLCESSMLCVTLCWAWWIHGMSCGQKHMWFVDDDVIFNVSLPWGGCLAQCPKTHYWHREVWQLAQPLVRFSSLMPSTGINMDVACCTRHSEQTQRMEQTTVDKDFPNPKMQCIHWSNILQAWART